MAASRCRACGCPVESVVGEAGARAHEKERQAEQLPHPCLDAAWQQQGFSPHSRPGHPPTHPRTRWNWAGLARAYADSSALQQTRLGVTRAAWLKLNIVAKPGGGEGGRGQGRRTVCFCRGKGPERDRVRPAAARPASQAACQAAPPQLTLALADALADIQFRVARHGPPQALRCLQLRDTQLPLQAAGAPQAAGGALRQGGGAAGGAAQAWRGGGARGIWRRRHALVVRDGKGGAAACWRSRGCRQPIRGGGEQGNRGWALRPPGALHCLTSTKALPLAITALQSPLTAGGGAVQRRDNPGGGGKRVCAGIQ